MKRTESKKLIYKVPVTLIKAGAVNTNVLAGSEHINRPEEPQGGDSIKWNPQGSTVGSKDVLAKPMYNLWDEE